MRWLDWVGTPSSRAYAQDVINIVQIGSPVPARMEESRQARANRVYDLVRYQQASIRKDCAEKMGCSE